jgi:ribosomal protein S18 acetylase RimI-like enzyme
MTQTLAAPAARLELGLAPHTLRPGDVSALRLPGPRGSYAVRKTLQAHPGRSVWLPETLEYALVSPWRNRPEIAHLEEVVATRNAAALIRAAFERCVAHGDELLIAIELEAERGPSRFQRAGLEPLEDVITYELDTIRAFPAVSRELSVMRVTPSDRYAIGSLIQVDHAAFPWLWRNSRHEFEVYLRTPGVDVLLIAEQGVPIAYTGSTMFAGWGHLDRIAVAPEQQGQGRGRDALVLAIGAMRRQGAARIALSTQGTNLRSQRLYERCGFQRTPELDYRLFGAWCKPGCRVVSSR